MGILRASLLLAFIAGAAVAAEPGHVEDFTTTLGGWNGGATETRVTSGGVGGASDPYMRVSNSIIVQLAVRNLTAPYVGDLIDDGVGGLSFYLRDVNGTEDLNIYVGVGTQANFWRSIVRFHPTAEGWLYGEVDFTDAGAWELYIGTGTFENALRTCDRMQFRHDHLSGDQLPSDGVGDFGVDRITILPIAAACSPADLAEPLGALDFSDVLAFLAAFGSMDPAADLAAPTGVFDFSDVLSFLTAFGGGCP
ncbi:MAG: GC-type dockerin domain-anchored protein [Phycisphaerales bacterium]